MNKNTFVKFSLTLISAAVLAACSSSGGNDDSAAKAAAAAAKAAADKAAADKAAADKAAAAEAKVKASTSVGHKLVKKTDSNFVLGLPEGTDTVTSSTGRSDNMDIELYRSLDTVVVSVPLKKENGKYVTDTTAPIGYVEDFDFRGNTQNTTGEHTLKHIYKTNGSTTGAATARTASATKTDKAGTNTGLALVYQNGRAVYIAKDETVTANGKAVTADLRNRDKTVAEVYGHRTFVAGDSLTGLDANGKIEGSEVAIANAPLAKADAKGNYVLGDNYTKVQYGRVTSKLDNVKLAETKTGVNAGAYGTKVVSYGEYGQKGTENSYFYRGVDDTAYSATLANDLATHYATYSNGKKVNAGKLDYQGHAVTYGFAHTAPGVAKTANNDVPNALGAQPQAASPQLVSGTHVKASIDLTSKAVTGSLYDVWSNGSQNLATFKGTLDNAGSISGTSARVAGGEGTFNANLFGKYADELGGALASNATDAKNSWGAVFGAKVQNVPGSAPVPAETSAWGVKTDAHK